MPRGAVDLHAPGDGRAEPHRGGGSVRPTLHLEGAGDRIGLRRDLAHAADRRVTLGSMVSATVISGSAGRALDHLRRHVEHRVAPVLARELHDHPAGLHHLAGLGADRGDDARRRRRCSSV